MNIEDYREFCLSLGDDIEEKLPFQKFKSGEGVLVFYVSGHMFSFFDCNDFSVISLKCQPERIEDLKAQHECIGNPYNESPKHWIGINPAEAPDELLKELTRNSYEIVKAKYKKARNNMMAELVLHKKSFWQLTTDELYELLRVRSEVFVVEQNCVYQDLDGDDQEAIHLWLTLEDKIVALARVCPAGTHMTEISIGRVITTERGKGYGKQIMLHAIRAAIEHFGATLIDIEAQEYAKGFYESVGFKQSSDTFMLDGIPHIKMTWRK